LWEDLAQDAFQLLDWTIASKALEKVVSDGLPKPFTYSMLADCYYYLNNKARAIDLYLKAIQKNNKNPIFYLKLGNIYMNEGEYNLAKNTYEEGIKKNPEKSQWLINAIKQIQ
jgi:tetratricopeptide (TPR) repeat protein